MKLSDWAKKNGVVYGTALSWFHNGTLPCSAKQLKTGTILVDDSPVVKKKLSTIIYSRVSSANKKSDLKSQNDLCQQFCISKGWEIEKSVKEIASGMNDNRPRLNKILELKNIRLIVLHKDRLTRFGFNYLERLVKANGGKIIVVNRDSEDETDLLKDFIAIITSFCCRLYGARRGQAKALKMKEELSNDQVL